MTDDWMSPQSVGHQSCVCILETVSLAFGSGSATAALEIRDTCVALLNVCAVEAFVSLINVFTTTITAIPIASSIIASTALSISRTACLAARAS